MYRVDCKRSWLKLKQQKVLGYQRVCDGTLAIWQRCSRRTTNRRATAEHIRRQSAKRVKRRETPTFEGRCQKQQEIAISHVSELNGICNAERNVVILNWRYRALGYRATRKEITLSQSQSYF